MKVYINWEWEDFIIEEIFNLDEALKDYWEIEEIQRKGAKALFCAF